MSFFFLLSEEVTPITEVPKAPSTADSSDNNTTSSGSSVPDKEDIVNKNAKNNNSDTDEGVVLVMEDRLEPPKVWFFYKLTDSSHLSPKFVTFQVF